MTNADYKIISRRQTDKTQGVTSGQVIQLKTTLDLPLRRVGYKDPETNKYYKFLKNNFDLDAKTVADIYKER